VLVPFPYTDLKGSKNRPAMVLHDNDRDETLIFISSVFHSITKFDVLIPPNVENNLKMPSILKLSKIATLKKDLIKGNIGFFNISLLHNINKGLIEVFDLT